LLGAPSKHHKHCLEHPQNITNIAWSTLKTSQTLLGAPSKHHNHCLEHPQNITTIAWSTLKTPQTLLGAPSKHHKLCLEHPQNTTNFAGAPSKQSIGESQQEHGLAASLTATPAQSKHLLRKVCAIEAHLYIFWHTKAHLYIFWHTKAHLYIFCLFCAH